MSNQVTRMTNAIAEMHNYVRAAAEPWLPGDSVKAGINRAARRLRISPRRATTLWYARQCAVLAEEIDQARAWYLDHVEQEQARLETRISELRDRQAALREKLNGVAVAESGDFMGGDIGGAGNGGRCGGGDLGVVCGEGASTD